MDKKGNFVIAPQFISALDFNNGRAVVITVERKAAVVKNPLINYMIMIWKEHLSEDKINNLTT